MESAFAWRITREDSVKQTSKLFTSAMLARGLALITYAAAAAYVMSASPHASIALVNNFDVGFTGSSGLIRHATALSMRMARRTKETARKHDRSQAGFGPKRGAGTNATAPTGRQG